MVESIRETREAPVNGFKDIDVKLKRFPFLAHTTHPILNRATLILPVIILLSYLLTVLYAAKALATDQEQGIKVPLDTYGTYVPGRYIRTQHVFNVLSCRTIRYQRYI